ncbi:MAG: hypothetical protein C0490_15180 [Marivirga sp.]|nr:hypothetical protein [Marivirga sp.]
MKLPFSIEEFLNVFEDYNLSVWPIQLLLYVLAVITIISLFKEQPPFDSVIFFVLAFFWFWMGIVYHLIYFSPINKAAQLFGALFVVQGGIFFYCGVSKQRIRFKFRLDFAGIAGTILIVYALLIYPLLGHVLGHDFPKAPTFGVPCPTTIFTFGILIFSTTRIPWYVIIIPFLWSLVGFSAAVQLSIREDFGLVIAGGIALIILLFYKPKNISVPHQRKGSWSQ